MDYLQSPEFQPIASDDHGKPTKSVELLNVIENDVFDGSSALHAVAQRRDWPSVFACLEFVSLLCGNTGNFSLNVNHQDVTGQTPLHIACSLGNVFAVYALLRWGADTEISDHRGFTPLHLAAIHGHSQIVKEILGISDHLHGPLYTTLLEAAACHPEVLALIDGHQKKQKPKSETIGRVPNRELKLASEAAKSVLEGQEAEASGNFNRTQLIFRSPTDEDLKRSIAVARKARAHSRRHATHS